jgi:hypothetical protein
MPVGARDPMFRNKLGGPEYGDARVPSFVGEHEAAGNENKLEELEGHSTRVLDLLQSLQGTPYFSACWSSGGQAWIGTVARIAILSSAFIVVVPILVASVPTMFSARPSIIPRAALRPVVPFTMATTSSIASTAVLVTSVVVDATAISVTLVTTAVSVTSVVVDTTATSIAMAVYITMVVYITTAVSVADRFVDTTAACITTAVSVTSRVDTTAISVAMAVCVTTAVSVTYRVVDTTAVVVRRIAIHWSLNDRRCQ